MTIFDELRERLKTFYARYDIYILPVLKFILALIVFIGINNMLGFLPVMSSLFTVVLLSLLCAVLPLNGMTVISILLIIIQCFCAGIGAGVFALILYLILALLYFRFVPGDAPALLLTPLAFSLHLPGAVPLALGLLRGPVSAVSAALSVVSWYFLQLAGGIASGADSSPLEVLQQLAEGISGNQELFLAAVAAALVVLVVSTIRKLCSTYSWEIAIGAGSIVYLLVMALGGAFMQVRVDVLPLVAGTIGAAVISLILEFFVYRVNYAGSQYLQFEDDEYYYYVKAIPRIAFRKAGRQERRTETAGYAGREQTEEPETADAVPAEEPSGMTEEPAVSADRFQDVDFEAKLEESLKDL